MPRCWASRARSMASMERGMLSGSTWAWMSITPLKFDCAGVVTAIKLKQKIQIIRSIASRHDFEGISSSLLWTKSGLLLELGGCPILADFSEGGDFKYFQKIVNQ